MTASWNWNPPTRPCAQCGKTIVMRAAGRARRWCSDACRMKAYRREQKR